jgi:hypothetical protein
MAQLLNFSHWPLDTINYRIGTPKEVVRTVPLQRKQQNTNHLVSQSEVKGVILITLPSIPVSIA